VPNRILKESICESRNLSECSFFAQDLYKRMITYADDYGRFNADPQIMLARLYPREMATVTINDVVDGLIELCGVGKIGFYTAEPRREVYGAFPRWGEHQRIRDSKKKIPEPTDTKVNDWYLRRFIPISLKVEILERDKFTCRICGRKIADGSTDARKLIKMGTGLFHFDHIVPCQQGGRATAENLRLTCAKCNLSRQKTFTVDEILSFSECCESSPQLAANRRDLPPNPIQSNPEFNPNPESNPNDRESETECFDEFWKAYPRKVAKQTALKAWNGAKADKIAEQIIEDVKRRCETEWKGQEVQFIPHPATYLHQRRWEDETPPQERTSYSSQTIKSNPALDYDQRTYSDDEFKGTDMSEWMEQNSEWIKEATV